MKKIEDLKLVQDAYVDNYGTNGDIAYYALATDNGEKEYMVMWQTTKDWDNSCEFAALEEKIECGEELSEDEEERYDELSDMLLVDIEDQSNACDWDNPNKIIQL